LPDKQHQAFVLHTLGQLVGQRDPVEAETLLRHSLTLAEALGTQCDRDPVLQALGRVIVGADLPEGVARLCGHIALNETLRGDLTIIRRAVSHRHPPVLVADFHYGQTLAPDSPVGADGDLALGLERLAGRLFAKGDAPDALAATREAVALYRPLAADAPAAYMPKLTRSLHALCHLLAGAGDAPAAIQVYDEVVGRFGAREEPALAEQVARALFNKGVTLGQLGRSEESREAFAEVLERYGDETDPPLGEVVLKTREALRA
jgi:tetratricopeptide (TPR) repeat protein